MKCPKCSGSLRLTSNGFYRNELETPPSVSCLNCGFYAEKPPEVEVEYQEVVKLQKKMYPKRLSTFGTYRSVLRDEFKQILKYKAEKMTWEKVRDKLAEEYPIMASMTPRSIQKAFWIVHDQIVNGGYGYDARRQG